MPKVPTHALVWSDERGVYELRPADPHLPSVVPGEEEPWFAWLGTHVSFSFQGQSGRLNVLKESRPRGSGYWYAYQTREGHTRKRYLGRTETLSLARLEETAKMLLHEQQPRQASDPGMALLSSKLSPPRLPTALVERDRLLAALDEALSTPLTLVSAPAGWGKTTLLSAWSSRQKKQVAWLSLDELDNSPTRFWVALIIALRRGTHASPGLGQTAVALLESPQPPELPAILTVLLAELESREIHPVPLVLVLDDYQVIDEPVIHQSLAFFLEHLPAKVHLILSSRVDPDLKLARWRAHGQLIEIRADELCFQEGEASRYLDHMLSPPLSEEEVSRLVKRTEGWIVGLQLAALAMQKRVDRSTFLQAFTGSQRYLLDYVQEDILARLPTPVRDFLLHSSILSHLDASICQAVTAASTQAASQQMLAFLERANLFLMPLDEERRSYRLHELFREALLAALHTTHPDLVPLLNRRAAAFYEAEGEWAEAITYWLAASDFSKAARLMEQIVEQFWLHGEAATMTRWALALPEVQVREHARLTLTTALYLLNTVPHTTREQRARVYQQMRLLMARVETVLQSQADETSHLAAATRAGTGAVLSTEDREVCATEDALLHRRLRLLRMFIVVSEATASEEVERLSAMQQEIEEELDHDEEALWQMVPLAWSFVLYYTVRREGAKLLPRLLEARQRVSREASRYADLKVRQWLALVALEAGQLRLAYEESLAALDLIKQMKGFAPLKGYFEVALAEVWYQWNRLEEARSLLHTIVQDAAAWQNLGVLEWGYTDLLQVALATGDWTLAQQAMNELVQRESFGTYPGWLPTIRAYWRLAQGLLKEASDWAAGITFPQGAWMGSLYYDAFPAVMGVYFAQQRWREAVELLERWSGHLDRPTNIRITLTYLAQYLVHFHQRR